MSDSQLIEINKIAFLRTDYRAPGYAEICEIEEFLFRDKHERIGANCWGVGGPCAHVKGGMCAEFISCQAAQRAIDEFSQGKEDESCPLFVHIDDAWQQAKNFYESVKGLRRLRNVDDRDSLLEHQFVDQKGEIIKPQKSLFLKDERSEQFLEWYSSDQINTALLLITRVTKPTRWNGFEKIDQSVFQLPQGIILSDPQKSVLNDFCQTHGLQTEN